jgi:DNA processing protein
MSGRRMRGYAPPKEVREATLAKLLEGTERRVPEDSAQTSLFLSGRSRGGMPVYYAGDLSLLHRPCVAIVGTRKVSEAGEARAKRLARELALEGVVVVSGLAMGVDTAAHTACLSAGGRTIAVIGTPMDLATPASNEALQELIYKEHLLLSPFPMGSQVHRGNFPRRNQVMAAITDATVVIEASDTSGTLHQSKEAVDLGRWLFITRSCANDPQLTWPKSFLKQRTAKVISSSADVLERVGRSSVHAPLRVFYGGSNCPDVDDARPVEDGASNEAYGIAEQLRLRVRAKKIALMPVTPGGDDEAFARALAEVDPALFIVGEKGAGREVPRILVVDELRDGAPARAAHQALLARGLLAPVAIARRRWSWLPCDNPSRPLEDTLDNLAVDPPVYRHLAVQVDPMLRSSGALRGVGMLWMPWERRSDFLNAVKRLGSPPPDGDGGDAWSVAAVDLVFDTSWLMFQGGIGTADAPPELGRTLKLRRRFFSARKEPAQIHLWVSGEGGPTQGELGSGWTVTSRRPDKVPGTVIANLLVDLFLADWSGSSSFRDRAGRTRLLERLGWSAWGDLRAETRETEAKFSVLAASRLPAAFENRPLRKER